MRKPSSFGVIMGDTHGSAALRYGAMVAEGGGVMFGSGGFERDCTNVNAGFPLRPCDASSSMSGICALRYHPRHIAHRIRRDQKLKCDQGPKG